MIRIDEALPSLKTSLRVCDLDRWSPQNLPLPKILEILGCIKWITDKDSFIVSLPPPN